MSNVYPVKIINRLKSSTFLDGEDLGTLISADAAGLTLTLPDSNATLIGASLTIHCSYATTIVPFAGRLIRVEDSLVGSIAGQALDVLEFVNDNGWCLIKRTNNTATDTPVVNWSFTDPGYMLHPSGLIQQWGKIYVGTDSVGNFNFPIVFPHACFQVLGNGTTIYVQEGVAQGAFTFANVSTTGFTCGNDGIGQLISFHAIGY